jgi:hypothetical protein
MNQTALNFNPYPENIFTPGTMNHRLYEYLVRHGQITTKELHNELKMDCARIRSDIRPYLRAHGMDYECKALPGDPGNRLYRIKSS